MIVHAPCYKERGAFVRHQRTIARDRVQEFTGGSTARLIPGLVSDNAAEFGVPGEPPFHDSLVAPLRGFEPRFLFLGR